MCLVLEPELGRHVWDIPMSSITPRHALVPPPFYSLTLPDIFGSLVMPTAFLTNSTFLLDLYGYILPVHM